jgi:hypothetical protein
VAITNGYAALTDVKAALRLSVSDTTDDALLELAIESASRMIDDDCGRVFYASGTGVTRYFRPDREDFCRTDDIITISTLATDADGDGTYETTWTATDYRKHPANNVAGGRAWPTTALVATKSLYFPVDEEDELTVAVTGNFGFGTAVPTAIKDACVLQSLRLFKRYDSPLGVAGFGDMGAVRVSRTDPDVFALIKGYRRGGPVSVA